MGLFGGRLMVNPQPDYDIDKKDFVSDFNEAKFQILRLHLLWQSCNNLSQIGKLEEWKWKLDTIWRELASDAKQRDKDREEEKTYFYQITKLNEKITKADKTKVLPKIRKKDFDWVWIVDGVEGCGKSVFALQLAKILDPTFNLSRVCMTPQEFTRAILKAGKGQCVVFDEAFTGLSSRASLTEINRLIVSLMMEMRQKNLFVIIVMPTIFLLDRYVAIFRARG